MEIYDTIRRKADKYRGKTVFVSGNNRLYGSHGQITQVRADITGEVDNPFILYFVVKFGSYTAILHESEVTVLL